jgi:molybdate transport system ATP-binding protein
MINIDINKRLNGSNGDMKLKVKLEIKEHDFIAIAGESGSGKTTFLRILAGLEEANGEIKVSDKLLF